MKPAKKVTRKTLTQYAGVLGRDSHAAWCLKTYDALNAFGSKPIIKMHNNSFTVEAAGKVYK